MLRYIHQSNLIENYDAQSFDAQSLIAWRFLNGIPYHELDNHCIQKLQKLITLSQNDLSTDMRGKYRKIQISVGGRIGAIHTLIQPLMDNWLLDYRSFSPKEMHIRFEKIHPFVDGNGRTGRMLMWWHERHLGQRPTIIMYKDRQAYYNWFR